MPNRPMILLVGVTVSTTGVVTASRGVLITAAEEHETENPSPGVERRSAKPTLAKGATRSNVIALPARRSA